MSVNKIYRKFSYIDVAVLRQSCAQGKGKKKEKTKLKFSFLFFPVLYELVELLGHFYYRIAKDFCLYSALSHFDVSSFHTLSTGGHMNLFHLYIQCTTTHFDT